MPSSPSLDTIRSLYSTDSTQKVSVIPPTSHPSYLTSRAHNYDASSLSMEPKPYQDPIRMDNAGESEATDKGRKNTHPLPLSYKSQPFAVNSNPRTKLGQTMLDENGAPYKSIMTDDNSSTRALGICESRYSQAASGTEQERIQPSNSNTVSQAASTVSGTISHKEKAGNLTQNIEQKSGTGVDIPPPVGLLGVGETSQTSTNSPDAWSRKNVLSFGKNFALIRGLDFFA